MQKSGIWEGIKNFFINYWPAIAVFLSPLKLTIIAITFLVVADFILGILRSRKMRIPIRSHIMKRTIIKLAYYYAAILIGFIAAQVIVDMGIEVNKIVVSLIALVEFKSCLESLDVLCGSKLFKKLLNQISEDSPKNLAPHDENKKAIEDLTTRMDKSDLNRDKDTYEVTLTRTKDKIEE